MPQASDEKPQIDRFREAARQLGCDEDEAVFDAKLKVIARQLPTDKDSSPGGQSAQKGRKGREP
jgi:hypothetical protein